MIRFALNTLSNRRNHRIYVPNRTVANRIANDIGYHDWKAIYNQYYTNKRQLRSRIKTNYGEKKTDQLKQLITKLDSTQSISTIRSDIVSEFEKLL